MPARITAAILLETIPSNRVPQHQAFFVIWIRTLVIIVRVKCRHCAIRTRVCEISATDFASCGRVARIVADSTLVLRLAIHITLRSIPVRWTALLHVVLTVHTCEVCWTNARVVKNKILEKINNKNAIKLNCIFC